VSGYSWGREGPFQVKGGVKCEVIDTYVHDSPLYLQSVSTKERMKKGPDGGKKGDMTGKIQVGTVPQADH